MGGVLFFAQVPSSGPSVGWSLAAAGLLILLNAFFVAYEFGLIAAQRSAFEAAAKHGKATSKAALNAISDLSLQLAGAQFGITMATLGLGYVGKPVLAPLIEGVVGGVVSEEATFWIGVITALAIVTFLHLVIGEMVPKNIAIASPVSTVRWLVVPYRAYMWLFGPVVRFLSFLALWGCRLVGVEPRDDMHSPHSAAELAAIVSQSSAEGEIEADSAELLQGALDFAERPVAEIAIPIDAKATIREGATPARAEQVIAASGQLRVPIVSQALGEARVVGYLHAKDLLKLPPESRGAPLASSLHRPMAVVRADRSLVQALRILKQLRRQMAVVIDDDGPVGIVSVEEVIEALVVPDRFNHQSEPATAQ